MSETTVWSEQENEIAINAYLDMLHWERAGRPYVKAEVNRHVQSQIPDRSRGSIEYKFQNISAILDDADLSYVTGYKPARNYQQPLRELVLSRITRRVDDIGQ